MVRGLNCVGRRYLRLMVLLRWGGRGVLGLVLLGGRGVLLRGVGGLRAGGRGVLVHGGGLGVRGGGVLGVGTVRNGLANFARARHVIGWHLTPDRH